MKWSSKKNFKRGIKRWLIAQLVLLTILASGCGYLHTQLVFKVNKETNKAIVIDNVSRCIVLPPPHAITSAKDVDKHAKQIIRTLSFSFEYSNERDPCVIYKQGKAHCVQYAIVYASLFNYLCKENGIDANAEVVRGQFYCVGINIHTISSSSFWTNHDLVRITTPEGNSLFDPSIYDFSWGLLGSF